MSPETVAIREHYDRLSSLYHTLWSEHIHHGYWDAEDIGSTRKAQERLIEELVDFAEIPRGGSVLDLGCGLGGASRWLARERACSVLGITISPAQAMTAARLTREAGLSKSVRFAVQDAHALDVPAGGFDAVWIVECSEHLAEKETFLAACAASLRPGGRLALCAWLRGEEGGGASHAALVAGVCAGMLCPGLGTMTEYTRWLRAVGFEDIRVRDVTPRVAVTWDRCADIVDRPEVRALLKISDDRTRAFVAAFPTMRRAYAEGAIRYGMLAARKP